MQGLIQSVLTLSYSKFKQEEYWAGKLKAVLVLLEEAVPHSCISESTLGSHNKIEAVRAEKSQSVLSLPLDILFPKRG